jgi:bacterioferritin-associated ferredoxin
MIVCLCHRVSDHTIKREVHAGCASFDALQRSLKVGTACGACKSCAREVFDQACDSAAAARFPVRVPVVQGAGHRAANGTAVAMPRSA